MMKFFFGIQLIFFTIVNSVLAAPPVPLVSDVSILQAYTSPVQLLTSIQSILLTVVLPVIVVGASLYIAYELFTAEGDESRMKKAWKSVAYTAVALIAIALSYAIVSIVTKLSF